MTRGRSNARARCRPTSHRAPTADSARDREQCRPLVRAAARCARTARRRRRRSACAGRGCRRSTLLQRATARRVSCARRVPQRDPRRASPRASSVRADLCALRSGWSDADAHRPRVPEIVALRHLHQWTDWSAESRASRLMARKTMPSASGRRRSDVGVMWEGTEGWPTAAVLSSRSSSPHCGRDRALRFCTLGRLRRWFTVVRSGCVARIGRVSSRRPTPVQRW